MVVSFIRHRCSGFFPSVTSQLIFGVSFIYDIPRRLCRLLLILGIFKRSLYSEEKL